MNNQELDKIYNVLKTKTKSFTEKDLREVILDDGYSQETADLLINKLKQNNFVFKEDLDKNKIKETDKKKEAEKLLKEIGKDLKKESKEKPKDSKKDKPKEPKKPKVNLFKKLVVFLKSIYFFFENNYYDLMDAINKVIPVNKLIDKIDKKFPSFIIFILFVVGLIFLIWYLIASGSISSIFTGASQGTITVSVVDVTGSAITGANVLLTANDENIDSLSTDAWGEVVFRDLKINKKHTLKLTVSKEAYDTKTKEITFDKKQIFEKITLDIDTSEITNIVSPEQEREISFFSDNVAVIGKNLDVRFSCSAQNKEPSPKQQIVITGKITVDQPANCGDLRIDVYSQNYETITNMIVPESNRINLSKKNQNYGTLEVTVKGSAGSAVSDAVVKIFKANDPTTILDESSIAVSTLATDFYGKAIFKLSPGNYKLSVDKSGYITIPKSRAYSVTLNNTTTASYNLFSINELNDIDCSNPIYAEFCTVSGDLNCDYDLLTPYLIMNPDGSCLIGTLGYIDVTLKDQNTLESINGDISLWKKDLDTNAFSLVATRSDVNKTVFNVLTNNTYQLRVSNTEQYGYLPPNPEIITTLDTNKIIYLEYQSWVNSGDVNVNVKYSGINVDGASVYLFYGSGENEDTPYPTDPKVTNSRGDVSFRGIRSGQKYYAMSILSYENIQGESQRRTLDANETINLNVNLQNQSRILNLKVNTPDYGISFYDFSGEKITEYVTNEVNGSDLNKEYIFNSNDQEIYAVISASGYSTYQTEQIILVPGDTVYKNVVLTPPESTPYSEIEYLGLFDQTGTREINYIDFVGNNNLEKEYQLKYKITLSPKQERDLSYAFVRLGNNLLVSDDYLYIKSIFAPDSEKQFGCRFSGELEDWNMTHYLKNYETDQSLNNCPSGKSKWAIIDFTDSLADTIVFTVNFKFQNGITNISNYKHYYRALTNNDAEYDFSPDLTNWQSWFVKPEGFFYAESDYSLLPFESGDYSFVSEILDSDLSEVEKEGSSYILYIDEEYSYNTKFLYLNQNTVSGEVVLSSQNTNDSLVYLNYLFLEKGNDLETDNINNTEFSIPEKTFTIGDWFDLNSSFVANNFFSTNDSPAITSNILEITEPSPLLENVRAYSKSDFFIDIITKENDNKIYVGENDVNFSVKSKLGTPLPNINIEYCLRDLDSSCVDLGQTNSQGQLLNTEVIIPVNFIDQNITFRFLFDSSYGLPNNMHKIKKKVFSGYGVYNKWGEDSLGSQITNENKLLFNNAVFIINGIKETSKKEKEYFIKKDSQNQANLRSVKFLPADGYGADDLNILKINQDINSDNSSIPRALVTNLTSIKANVLLNKNISEDRDEIFGTFENQIHLGNYLNNPIIFSLNTPTKINVQRVALETELNTQDGSNGFDKDTKTLELISEKAEEKSFVYSIKNKSTEEINISDIVMDLSNNIDDKIDLEYTVLVSEGGQQADLKENKKEVVLYFAENYSSGQTTPSDNICSIPVGHTAYFTFAADLQEEVSSKIEGEINILFEISNSQDLSIGTHEIEINTNLYSAHDVLEISSVSSMISLSCKSNEEFCSSSKLYTVENKTETYVLRLEDINLVKTSDSYDYPQTETNFNIDLEIKNSSSTINPNTSDNVLLEFSANYSEISSIFESDFVGVRVLDVNRDLEFSYKINNTLLDKISREIKIHLNVYAKTIEDTLNDYGLTSNLCLGSGQNISENDIFIIANCQQTSDCRSGEENVPRIKYYWGKSSSQSPIQNWETECIDSEFDYNLSKTHCDSTQMFISLLHLIKNGQILLEIKNETNNYYVYLMADGLSKDFLKDFLIFDTAYTTNFIDGVVSSDVTFFTDQNIDYDQLKIIKENANGEPTNNPGKYKISINSDFSREYDSPLHITLTQVQELPYVLNNFLYYLPINGNMGLIEDTQKVHREDYGVTVDYLNENDKLIPVTGAGQDIIYLYDRNDSQTTGFMSLYASNYSDIESKRDVEYALKSNKKLLEINLLEITYEGKFIAEMKYSPTYPIPLFALVSNPLSSDFSYYVTESINNPIAKDLKANPFITWMDYSDESKVLEDNRIIGQAGNYLNSVILSNDFNAIYNTDKYKLLKTILYLPQPQANTTQYTVTNYHMITESNYLGDQKGTKIATIGEDNYVLSKNPGLVPANNINIKKISDLFSAVKNNSICIHSDPVTTQIRWKENNTKFPSNQEDDLIKYYRGLLENTTESVQ